MTMSRNEFLYSFRDVSCYFVDRLFAREMRTVYEITRSRTKEETLKAEPAS